MRRHVTIVAAMLCAYAYQAWAAEPGALWQPSAAEIGPRCDAIIAETKKDIAKLEQLPLARVNKQTTLYA